RRGAARPQGRGARAAPGHGGSIDAAGCRHGRRSRRGGGRFRAPAVVRAGTGLPALRTARRCIRQRGAAHRGAAGWPGRRCQRGRKQPPSRTRPRGHARRASLALRARAAGRQAGGGRRSAGHQLRRPALSRAHRALTPRRPVVDGGRGIVMATSDEDRPMSDPRPRHPSTATDPDSQRDEAVPRRRGGASLLLWLLLLIVVVATAWYFLGRHDDRALPPDVVPIEETMPRPSQSPVSKPPASRETTTRERAAPTPTLPDPAARPLSSSKPDYPAAARRAREQGTVVLEVEVGPDGQPDEVSVARHSGSRELDRAALQAVRDWSFEPAIHNGKAVASSVRVP